MEVNPSKLIRYDLLVVLVGVACSLAAERFVNPPADISHPVSVIAIRFSTAAFLLTALNFLHAKTVTLDDEDYNRVLVNLPGFALADFALNVLVVLTFVFMSLYLANAKQILFLNITLRVIDIPLTLLVRKSSNEPVIRKAQNSWFVIDIIAICCFSLGLVFHSVRDNALDISLLFFGIIIADITTDYTVNYHLYFSSAGSWQDMASLWDDAQGRDGDVYRRKIIIPAIASLASIAGRRVLDLGCGNGCLSRALIRLGSGSVTAVDRHQSMLAKAQQYPSTNISYLSIDLDDPTASLGHSAFDIVIACFSLQDCNNIGNPLKLLSTHLAVDGRAFLIYENDRAFTGKVGHVTTNRLALDSSRRAGRGQRWLVSWNRSYAIVGQSDVTVSTSDRLNQLVNSPSQGAVSTVTRYWDTISYLKESAIAGLSLASWPIVLHPENVADGSVLEKYENNPRFSLIELMRQDDQGSSSATIPLIFVAGVSGTGKSRLSEYIHSSMPDCVTISLDDFYHEQGDARIPLKHGRPDWESRRSLDLDAAAKVVHAVVNRQVSTMPVYDMATSHIIGERIIDPSKATCVIVEGVFSFDLFIPQVPRPVRMLVTSSARTVYRRVMRDIKEKRRGFFRSVVHSCALLFKARLYESDYVLLATCKVSCTASLDTMVSLLKEHSAGLIHR